ncbi:MAG: phosphoserine phosphatase SerB [Pseudomonadota bacterium]|nr:phosphoserine phosphatase SerB [Pseudomonadota bacterium]
MDSVLVLIAAPGSGAISDQVAARFGDVLWLAQGEALETSASLVALARNSCAGLPIDISVVPRDNRRKRVLLADMDSTMIQQECIDELGVVAGVGDHIKSVTARAMRGEIDFEGALKERVALLKGLHESVIQEVISKRISFMPGGKTLVATMKKHGAYTALVSGGFTAFTSHVAQALGFHENHANTLLVKDGALTGEVALPILGKGAKVESLRRICSVHGLSRDDVLAVGDGANDIPMLQAAGMGVALHAKPRVQEEAQYVVNHGNLTALLYLQGYAQAEFVA